MPEGKGGMSTGWFAEQRLFPGINHYYGDSARQLMLGAVAVMMLGAPFYADSLRAEFPLEIIAAVLIVGFAALTNPFKRGIVMGDAVLTGVGAAIFGTWAFLGYGHVDSIAFLLRDVIALLFLFAFYFSLKTLRAMILHQIGKPDSSAEFRRTMPQHSAREIIEEDIVAGGPAPDPLAREKEVVERIYRHERGD